jgi:hypothetical protein
MIKTLLQNHVFYAPSIITIMIDMVKLNCPKWLKKCFPFLLLVTQLMFPSKTIVCNWIKFPMTKTTQKSNISCTISRLKDSKLPSLNPTHQMLSNNTKAHPNSSIKPKLSKLDVPQLVFKNSKHSQVHVRFLQSWHLTS